MYYEYLIFCEIRPTRLTLHSVVTYFFNTKDLTNLKYKVEIDKEIIRLKTNIEIRKEFSINLVTLRKEKFNCSLIHTIKHEMEYFEEEEYTVSGLIEYGVDLISEKDKKKRKRIKHCPIKNTDFQDNLEVHFKKNIEKQLGVEVIDMKAYNFKRHPSQRLLANRIRLDNLMDMNIRVKVVDKELFNELQFKSVFQKKSYGLGNLIINRIIN